MVEPLRDLNITNSLYLTAVNHNFTLMNKCIFKHNGGFKHATFSLCYMWDVFCFTYCAVEVFTEDPGPVRVGVYILKGQPGPGRVPIYYFGSRVCLTLCVIPESSGEHCTRQRSVSVSMRVFCNLQFVKLGWCNFTNGVNVVLQADGDHGFLHEWCEKKAETKLKRCTCYWTRTQ